MLCTLLTGECHRLLHALSAPNRFLHQSWNDKMLKFTRAALLFQVALGCFVSVVCSEERMTEHCLFALQLLSFQILKRFVGEACSAPAKLSSGIYVQQS